jgi:hypothetical protein
MSLPEFLPNDLLPPGLYVATLDEIEIRFSQTPRRRELFARLNHFVTLAQSVGAIRLFVNGSYVTTKSDPGDVDVVIWLTETFLNLLSAEDDRALELQQMFLTRIPKEAFAVFDQSGWDDWIEFFSFTRAGDQKGIVEIRLR